VAAFSDYIEAAIANVLRGTTFPAVPTNFYLALYTVAPTDAGGGTEVTGGSYARIVLSPAVGTWNAPGVGTPTTSNTAQIVSVTATADWGTVAVPIVAIGLFDAAVAGNLWLHGLLTASRVVLNGQRFVMDPGEFDITFQ
jgi:hypothetical protein